MSNCSGAEYVNAFLVRPELEYRAQRRRVVEAAHQDVGQRVEPANQIELLEIIAQRARRLAPDRLATSIPAKRMLPAVRRLEPVDRPITPMKPPAGRLALAP
jgi:hypothetical protein